MVGPSLQVRRSIRRIKVEVDENRGNLSAFRMDLLGSHALDIQKSTITQTQNTSVSIAEKSFLNTTLIIQVLELKIACWSHLLQLPYLGAVVIDI